MKKFRFGHAFADELAKVSSIHKGRLNKKSSFFDLQNTLISEEEITTSKTSSWIKALLICFICIIFGVLTLRLMHLQIARGEYNRVLADSNRIQIKTIHAPRGVIYDRNGKILAQNEPGFRLMEKDADNKLKVTQLTRDQALKMEVENDKRLQDLEIDTLRTYPFKEKMSHILGYVGEITEEELKDTKFNVYQKDTSGSAYKIGDRVGRGGVEETYEKILRGIDGGEIIEVDSQGKKIRTLGHKDAKVGQNLYLTIDADLQLQAANLLEESVKKASSCCGVLISEDPQTGQILSLVSIPSFSPDNIFDALTAPNFPLLNRVIAGTYPPGSTFKIASSLAGLSSGKINSSTKIEDKGVMFLGPYKFTNWYFTQYGRTEGFIDLVTALKRSNDIFFYHIGERVGEKKLAEAAKSLGLGKKLGIDIPGEIEGVIPDNAWKVENLGEVWFPGDSLHMAIGQGFVLTTPLQVSHLISTIAATGQQYPPHLGLKIKSPSGKLIKEFKYDFFNKDKFKESDIDLIKRGLELVPQNGGTAWPFFNFPIKTAGKTGTAEFGDSKKTHAWYASYAPSDDPKIVITVLVEGGGEGSSVAAPVAKELYRWFFSPDKNNLIKDIYPVASESARTLGE